MPADHPLQQRFLAEDLTRRRRADESLRCAAAQRQGRIDPNPHQVDAMVFALRRVAEGGCILADEVGLGKTIEAGLVIAQLLADGKRRVLVLAPKALIGQWQNELARALLDRRARGARGGARRRRRRRVRPRVGGGERGAAALAGAPAFDLCVIDEAHEIFAASTAATTARGATRPTPTSPCSPTGCARRSTAYPSSC